MNSNVDGLRGETALFGGVTGSSLVAAFGLLPPPFNVIVSSIIPFTLAIVLWYVPFIQMRFKMQSLRELSVRIEEQLVMTNLSDEDRRTLSVALQAANKRIIELQFKLLPPEEVAAEVARNQIEGSAQFPALRRGNE